MVLAAAPLPAVRAVRASAVRAPKVGRPGATNRQATCRGPRRTRRRRRHPRQALGLYWATSGAYSLVQNVALEVRSVRRANDAARLDDRSARGPPPAHRPARAHLAAAPTAGPTVNLAHATAVQTPLS